MTRIGAFIRVHWVAAPAALLLVVVCLQPVHSIDLWIHLAVGRKIAADRRVPTRDTFSHTAAGRDFVAHEWLSQVILYQVYKAGGLRAIIALKLVLAGITFALFYCLAWIRSGNAWIAAALVCLGILAARKYLDYRPMMFSYPLIALLLLAIDALRRRKLSMAPWLILAFGLSVLWINLHGLAVVGLVIVALVLVSEGAGALLQAGDDAGRRPLLIALAVAIPLIILGFCCNPRGMQAITYPFSLGVSKQALDNIHEWRSPNFHNWDTWATEAVLLLGLVLLLLPGGRRRISDIVLLVAFAHAALFSDRHGALLVAAAIPAYAGVLAEPVARLQDRWSSRERTLVWTTLGLALPAVCVAYAFAHAPGRSGRGESIARRALAMDSLPEGAVAYLRAHRPRGQMYNLYEWGGYLMFEAPEIPVFVDGRADVYYGRPLRDYLSILNARCGWGEKLDDWDVGFLLLKPGSPVRCHLKEHPEWREVYIDKVAVVVARVEDEPPARP